MSNKVKTKNIERSNMVTRSQSNASVNPLMFYQYPNFVPRVGRRPQSPYDSRGVDLSKLIGKTLREIVTAPDAPPAGSLMYQLRLVGLVPKRRNAIYVEHPHSPPAKSGVTDRA